MHDGKVGYGTALFSDWVCFYGTVESVLYLNQNFSSCFFFLLEIGKTRSPAFGDYIHLVNCI